MNGISVLSAIKRLCHHLQFGITDTITLFTIVMERHVLDTYARN
jgi:hypothetical protein